MHRLILALFAVTTLLSCTGESATSSPTAENPRAPQAREGAASNEVRARRGAARADARRDAILRERLTMKDHGTRSVPAIPISELPEGAPHLVALVILDTLRADRTSLCGHDKPNTPVLEALAKTATSWTCDAYSPATWTLPAHASLFTGDTTAAHGVHTLGTPLADSYETFAETYASRGYQTLFISANPVFNKPAGGFWQGFDRVVVAKGLVGPLRAESFSKVVAEEIARLDKDKPVFLVVNIFDAHDPYPVVPAGLDWVDPIPRVNLHPHTADPENPYYAYVTGTMSVDDRPGYLQRIQDSYDHAVYVADRNLGALVRLLRQAGWLKAPHRVAITSDHGEHLGEHGLLRHGSATWQTVTRVPFMLLDTTPTAPASLPSVLNTTTAYHLLVDGKAPAQPLLVESASAHNAEDFKPSWMTVSLWASPTDKIMEFDGKRHRYDLASDPMEQKPLPLTEDHPLWSRLNERQEAHEASIEKALATEPNADVMQMLKSVGYVQ